MVEGTPGAKGRRTGAHGSARPAQEARHRSAPRPPAIHAGAARDIALTIPKVGSGRSGRAGDCSEEQVNAAEVEKGVQPRDLGRTVEQERARVDLEARDGNPRDAEPR